VRSSNDLRCSTTAWATARLDFFVIPNASLDASVVILFFISSGRSRSNMDEYRDHDVLSNPTRPKDVYQGHDISNLDTVVYKLFFFQKAAKPWIILDFSVKQIHHLFLLYNLYHDFVRVVQICCLCR
jgi:hypothetical protein